MSTDWTGSEADRRRHGADISGCPAGGKLTETAYRIPCGTTGLVKRVGDPDWKPYATTAEHLFRSVYRQSTRSLTFFASGWLLCVRRRLAQPVRIDLSNRFYPVILETDRVQDTPTHRGNDEIAEVNSAQSPQSGLRQTEVLFVPVDSYDREVEAEGLTEQSPIPAR